MNSQPTTLSKRLLLSLVLLVATGFFPLWLLGIFLVVATCLFDWYVEAIFIFALFLTSFHAANLFYLCIIVAVLVVIFINQLRTSVFKS